MTVPLDKPLKRSLQVGGNPYTLTIAADGLRLVPKGHRNGIELRWDDLVSGDAALAVALNASLDQLRVDAREKPQAATTKATGSAATTPIRAKRGGIASARGRVAARPRRS